MMAAQAPGKTMVVRKPTATVLRNFGTSCPAGYRVGERIRLQSSNLEAGFKCTGAYEALAPFLDVLAEPANASSECRFMASCSCPLADSEVVFYLYTQPT